MVIPFKTSALHGILILLTLAVMGPPPSFAASSTDATVVTTNSSTNVSASPPAESAPTGLAPVHIGPLEITPGKVFVRIQGTYNHMTTVIRLKIKNTSASDVKFMLFSKSFTITDNFGSPLYENHRIKGGGLNFSQEESDKYQQAFMKEKSKLTILIPNQVFEAQLTPDGNGYELGTKDGLDFYMKHRPKTMTLSAVIGVETIEEVSQLYSFSLSDVPIQINDK